MNALPTELYVDETKLEKRFYLLNRKPDAIKKRIYWVHEKWPFPANAQISEIVWVS